MPENNYEERLRELDRRYEEQIRLAQIERLTNQLPLIEERINSLEQDLEEMKAHNKRIEQINREKKEELYGTPNPERGIRGVFEDHFETHPGNHRDAALDFANEYVVPVNIFDENGKEQTLFPHSKEEIEALENEIKDLRKTYNEKFEERRANLSENDKAVREQKFEEIDREEQLKQAYEFLTYYDTSTTKGYPNLANLTEDEVLNIYNEFYNKRNEPGYSRIWEETNERILKGDREVIGLKKEEPIIPAGLKEEELTPVAVALEPQTPEIEEPELFGPPESLKYPGDMVVSENIEIKEPEEPLIEGTKVQKGKLAKFKEWVKNHKKQLIVAGLVTGGVIITGSVLAGLVACGALTAVTTDPNLSIGNDTSTPQFDNVSDIMMPDNEQTTTGLVEQQLTPEEAPVVDMNGPIDNEFYVSAENAAEGIDAIPANTEVGPFQTADLVNPETNEYAETNPNNLTAEQLEQLKADGYTVPAYTNDPSVIGLGGEQIAEQGQISGFGRSL